MRVIPLLLLILAIVLAGYGPTMMRGLSYGVGREAAHSAFRPQHGYHRRYR